MAFRGLAFSETVSQALVLGDHVCLETSSRIVFTGLTFILSLYLSSGSRPRAQFLEAVYGKR